MLSDWELESIQQALTNNPSKSVEKRLENQLAQHKYALKYPLFQPLSHHRQFINRKTDDQTLHRMIDIAKDSTLILLDTESTPVYRRPNRPSLIQFQLIQSNSSSTVIIVEVNHLPPTKSTAFEQIQEFFRIVLDSNQIIYTWGTIEELKTFAQFNLFNIEQIYQPINRNLQDIFKDYWRQCHKHRSTEDCKCEKCLGRKPDQKWKLLDAVAHQLNECLDKRHTCSPFDIGLDPQLKQLRPEQLKYRSILTDYAANDVLSMEKLMMNMQERPPPSLQAATEENEDIVRIQNQNSSDPTGDLFVMMCTHSSSFLINATHQSTPNHEQDQTNQIDQQFEEKDFDHHRKIVRTDSDSSERIPKRQRHEHQDEINGYKPVHRSEHQDQADSPERFHNQLRSKRQEQTDRLERIDYQYWNEHRERTTSPCKQDPPVKYRHDSQNRYQGTNRPREYERINHSERNDPQHRSQRANHAREQEQNDQQSDPYRKRQRPNIDTETKRQLDDHNKRRRRDLETQRLKMKIATTNAERKKYRNRISTLKQRQRKYKYEFIRRGIDPRFSITIVQEILRRYDIPYTALNISKSKMTYGNSLYIGIDDRSKLHEYENRTKSLFTTDFYNEFCARNHL